jgi:hypothetical protein
MANALSVIITSNTRISATPRSLTLRVPHFRFQVQIARRDIELDLEVRHRASAGSGQSSIREEHTGRTSQGLQRRLHPDGEADAAYSEQVGVEPMR